MATVSNRVKAIPPYLFSELQIKKEELKKRGVDVIDLGIGAPDLPTPDFICDRLGVEMRKPENHRYPPFSGTLEFKQAVANFYKKRYQVELNPHTEVLALIGSKEGIANLMQALINPGEKVLVPDPGYPVYRRAVRLAGGEAELFSLDSNHGYIPQFDTISDEAKHNAKLMLLNYPNNPTAATVELNVFKEAVAFSAANQLTLVHDAAYDLVTFSNYKAPSVLQVEGAKRHAVELGSLSKGFSMTGWRIGYIVGNQEVIQALATLKSNIDSSQFLPIQLAAATALNSDMSTVKAYNAIYHERSEKLYLALNKLGLETQKVKGTFFLWSKVPKGYTSDSFMTKLLDEAGIIATPGTVFGPSGEGYIRFALTVTIERLDEVINRLRQLKL